MNAVPNPPIPPALTDRRPPITPKLNAALAKVQAKLPKLERDRTVTVETKKGEPYSYSYATLSNLTEAVLPLLAEHGLAFAAMPGLGEAGKMSLNYALLHESGESLTGEFPLAGDGGIQMLGGRITYARRYCLAAVVGIAADEDDEGRLAEEGPRPAQRAQRQSRQQSQQRQDAAPAQRAAPPPSAPPPLPGESTSDGVTAPQLTKIATVFGAIGWSNREDKLRAASTIVGRPLGSSKDLTKAEAHTLIEALELVAADPDPASRLGELVAEVRSSEMPAASEGGES